MTRVETGPGSLLGLVSGLASGLLPGVLLVGCASPVSVRELATGHIDTPAYELRGEDLPSLQDQASRLCPNGGQLLHLGYRGDGLRAPGDSWWGQRWSDAQRLVAPVQAQAQLTVVCQPDASRTQLRAQVAKPEVTPPAPPLVVAHEVDMLVPETVTARAPVADVAAAAAASAPEPVGPKHAQATKPAAPKSAPAAASAPRVAQTLRQTPYPVLGY